MADEGRMNRVLAASNDGFDVASLTSRSSACTSRGTGLRIVIKECRVCKAKSDAPNPVTKGADDSSYWVTIAWLHGTPENPTGRYCNLCYTTFRLSFKKEFGDVGALIDKMNGGKGQAGCHELVGEFLGARNRVIHLMNIGTLTAITRGPKLDAIQADLVQNRKACVQAFRTQQKMTDRVFDGCTVKAYIADKKKDPRAAGETISMEWYEGVYQECVLWSRKKAGHFELHVQDMSGSSKIDQLASSETAVRSSDLQREFDSAASQVVNAGQYEDVKQSSEATDVIEFLGRLSTASTTASTSALGGGQDGGDADSSADDEDIPLSQVSKESFEHSDKEDDLLERLTGVKSKSRQVNATKGARGKTQAKAKAKIGKAARANEPKAKRSRSRTKGNPRHVPSPASVPPPFPTGGSAGEQEPHQSKRPKVSASDLDPALYLDSNGLASIRESFRSVLRDLEDNPILQTHASEADKVVEVMTAASVKLKGVQAEFSAKYWMIRKRTKVPKNIIDLLEEWKGIYNAPLNFTSIFCGDIDHSVDVPKAQQAFEQGNCLFHSPRISVYS